MGLSGTYQGRKIRTVGNGIRLRRSRRAPILLTLPCPIPIRLMQPIITLYIGQGKNQGMCFWRIDEMVVLSPPYHPQRMVISLLRHLNKRAQPLHGTSILGVMLATASRCLEHR
jgi:hypothetical protein